MAKIHSRVIFPVELAEVGGTLYDLTYNVFLRGHERSYENGILTLNGLDPNIQPSFAEMQTVVSNGGYFEGIKLGLEFTAAGAGRTVPAIVPGATYTDEEGATQTRTWAEWIRSQSNITVKKKVDENLYIIKAMYNGTLLNSDELVPAHGQTGVTVLEWAEVQARNASEDWELYEI